MAEYFLVAVPPEHIANKVAELKKTFAEEYGLTNSFVSEPCIQVGNFFAVESMEETIIRWTHRVCSQVRGFEVVLNNYSGIPSHTIFLRIQDHSPFKSLSSNLKVIDEYIRSNGYTEARFVTRPYLPIAEELEPAVYTKAMLEYSGRLFHDEFFVSELLLLKRRSRFEPSRQVNVFGLFPPDTNSSPQVAQLLKHIN
jgi:hypothetical protein